MKGIAGSNTKHDVPTVRLVHQSPWQLRSASNENSFKRRALEQSASNQTFLERLEAENAQLRRSVVELVLQIQALRDSAR
jgi:hypothetical protein